VPRLSGQKHPHVVDIAKFVTAKSELWLKEAGAVETWYSLPGIASLSGGQHQAGTCRMGNDPKTSVVNRHCQVHDADNLFVVDGSVHVTNGTFNPALTIIAIGYYAGAWIAREWKGTRFRP
jgi:choline dehydrogenase-like flavoprotein